jgi:hypothetical protein
MSDILHRQSIRGFSQIRKDIRFTDIYFCQTKCVFDAFLWSYVFIYGARCRKIILYARCPSNNVILFLICSWCIFKSFINSSSLFMELIRVLSCLFVFVNQMPICSSTDCINVMKFFQYSRSILIIRLPYTNNIIILIE